jgi:Ser/Thr protein kinase RdoA (MazF antagonist)
LRVRSINESRTENEVFQIAASEGHRLVVTFDKKENESS